MLDDINELALSYIKSLTFSIEFYNIFGEAGTVKYIVTLLSSYGCRKSKQIHINLVILGGKIVYLCYWIK